jgi:hypothetical protein
VGLMETTVVVVVLCWLAFVGYVLAGLLGWIR